MPLALKVQPELDEGALDDVKRVAHDAFGGLGRELGPVLAQGLQSSIGGALSGVTSEFGAFGKAAQSALAAIPEGAGAAALGIGGIAVAAAAAGKALYDLGSTWDSIADSMTIATGKTGEDLAALQKVVGDVGSMTAASLTDIGKVVEQLSQQFPNLDVAGESVRVMASDIATLDAAGQAVNIRELGLAMRVFGVSAESGTKALDDFAAVARATGMPINTIITEVRSGAPIFKQFGMSMAEASSYLASFDAAGVDAGASMAGLRLALVHLSGDGRGAREALQETITEIKRLSDEGRNLEARQLAIETFGKRAFAPMLEAITSGALDLDKLNKALDGTIMTIQQMKKATDDAKEGWQQLGNTMQTRFKPLADTIFKAVNDGAQLLTGHLNEIQGGFKVTADRAGDLNTQLERLVELQRQFQPDSPLGRMLLPGGVPGAPTQGGIGGPGGIGSSMGTGKGYDLGPNNGQGGFYDLPGGTSGGGAGGDLVPYGPGYGEPPLPGESPEHYRQRMTVLERQHDVAEKQAELDKLEASHTATAEQLTAARNNLLQAQVRLNEPVGGGGGGSRVEVPYGPGFGAPPRPGETSQQYSAEQNLLEAQHTTAEARANLAQVESNAAATTNELTKARNELAKAEEGEAEAQLRLNDAVTRSSKQLDDMGGLLDQDFGLSQGLPGLAENLIRFVATLAAAPLLGPLAAISQAQGGPNATGSGLIGMAGAQGAFGPQYQVGGFDQSGRPYSAAASSEASMPGYNTNLGSLNSPADIAAGGNRVAALYATAAALEGTPYSQALRNDCSGMVAQLASAAVGLPPPDASQRFNTVNEGQWLQSHGFRMGQGPPGSLRIGWNPLPGNAGHTAATLPGGENAESGGSGGGFRVGPDAAGSNSPQFTQHAWLPMSATPYQTYDGGGMLMPGTTIAVNNTGMPEHVIPQGMPNIAAGIGSGPAPGPGAGQPFSSVGQGATAIGGAEQRTPPGGGASAGAGGGLMGAATGAAAMAADMFAPGSGAAVQMASQEIQRAIKFGSQVAGIGMSGLMETFLPAGGSQLANNNWLTRIGGAFAGMAPQLPNMAGKAPSPAMASQQAPPPMPPAGQHTGTGAAPGPQTGVHIENYNVVNSEDRAGQDLARYQMAASAPQGTW